MKHSLLLGLGLLTTLTLQAQAIKKDSICRHPVNYDAQGKILSWFQPQTPGAGFSHVIKLASEFIKKSPNSPKNGLKLYLTHCSMYRDAKEKSGFRGSDWPHNPVCLSSGLVQSLVLDYRVYSGDDSYIPMLREFLDHHIKHGTTPANWAWANVPFASSDAGDPVYDGASKFDTAATETNQGRGDGTHVLEVDKIGEMGIAYVKFYEVTGDKKYLQAGLNCADALAKHVRTGVPVSRFHETFTTTAPWPFRVHGQTGKVLEDYTANIIENVRTLDELLRIKVQINLSPERVQAYQKARDIAWKWLYSFEGPMKTFVWKGYFEDIRFDPRNLNRVQNIPMETARYLIKNPQFDRNLNQSVPALLSWVKNVFGEPGLDAINEQTGCYYPMGSHTARYASINALWYERTKDERFKEEAYRHFNLASYMTEPDGVVQVGPNWGTEIWFSDGYGDYIRHFMEGLAAIPEWAPANENHLLKSSSVVQKISYKPSQITYKTFDATAEEVLRLTFKPGKVKVNGQELPEVTSLSQSGSWTWQPLANGGVLRIRHTNGQEVSIQK